VCIDNPDAVPGPHNPPRTPPARYATRQPAAEPEPGAKLTGGS